MGVDAYQTNQTSRTTFRATQGAAPVKVPPPQPDAAPSAECRPSAVKCRPLDYVPPLDWVPPLDAVKCRPLSNSRPRFCRASTPMPMRVWMAEE